MDRRISRERQARQNAEQLLIEKSAELYDSLQQAKSAEKKLRLALWACQESFWEWHAHNDEYYMRAFKLDWADEHQWRGSPISLLKFIHPDDIGNLEFNWMLAVHGGQQTLEVCFRFRRHARYVWVRLRGRVLHRDAQQSALHIVGTIRDITRERHAEHSFHLMASAFSSSKDPMLVLTRQLKISECNEAFLKMVGAGQKQQCLGRSLHAYLVNKSALPDTLEDQQQFCQETDIIAGKHTSIPAELTLAVFEHQEHGGAYVIATLRDISERKANEARLQQMAMHDELTGLTNRAGLHDEVCELIEVNGQFSIMFIDLDGFKLINDTAGHDCGDNALKSVAAKLTLRFGTQGIVTRWGGDEFVVILPNAYHEMLLECGNELISDIEADKIVCGDIELTLSASIGIAEYPMHGDTVESLLQNADAAMYQAKLLGKGRVFLYEAGLLESMQQQVTMLSELRRAVNDRALEFYLQGKYNAHSNLCGAELLCRWRSALHGNVPPDVFIPLAEEHGLDTVIGWLALEAACEYLVMMEVEAGQVPLSINVSANQLLSENFADQALAICKEHKISPQWIEIEITERIFICDEAGAINALNRLQHNGFKIALDDFGAGFSALSYLRSFAFEVVKLDKSLIMNIHKDAKALSLVQGIIAMLQGLGLEIVAEGVEQIEYVALLHSAKVQQMQGYFFDKPAPYDQFLARHARRNEPT